MKRKGGHMAKKGNSERTGSPPRGVVGAVRTGGKVQGRYGPKMTKNAKRGK